jgi:peroxiredoxin
MRVVPHLNELHEKYAGKGLTVVGVSNESEQVIESTISKVKMAFPVARLSGSAVDAAYQVRGVPQSFLIDRTGKLLWQGHPSKLTEEQVSSLLE